MKITRIKSYTDTLEYVELKKSVAIKYNKKTIGLLGGNFFVSKKDFKRYKDPFDAVDKIKKRYQYFDNTFWQKFNKTGFATDNTLDIVYNNNIDPMLIIKNSDFNEDNLTYFYRDAHLLYKLDEKYPMSIPYHIHYIGGVCNDNFNLDIAESVLLKSDLVWDVKKINIPYYNCDNERNKTIEFMIKLPQNTYTKLCKHYQDDECWTCRVKDALVWKSDFEDIDLDTNIDFDFVGLKQAYIGNKYE